MGRAIHPLKLPASVKAPAACFAEEDGVSLNQWTAAVVAQKVGTVETAAEFCRRRGEGAQPGDLRAVLGRIPDRRDSRWLPSPRKRQAAYWTLDTTHVGPRAASQSLKITLAASATQWFRSAR